MFRSKNWFSKNLWKPKNAHSLDHLKYLHAVLTKNQNITEGNRGLLVESLRSIAEILIWGDQNDSSVFDFFLEKNMLSFFLKILNQKCGSYVCVQLLQTLNILFENIRNETSLYYLLSNNHVNSIIVHKFDFSDEEVMAYYISFLKTLSLKLNCHTIHFFYNEHTNDFPLYTEAIKFFKHSESMVRIAVRTLTLNVYKVEDKSMLRFIRDKTAAPYFSNLVWFISNHILELDSCIHKDFNVSEQSRLAGLVAEHLDHLHYLNDILCLNIDDLNVVLINHLLNKLLIPLYIMSLSSPTKLSDSSQEMQSRISAPVSLFLLSQVFLIVKEKQLLNILASILLKESASTISKIGSNVTLDRIISIMHKSALLKEDNKLKHTCEDHIKKKIEPISDSDGSSSFTNRNVTDEEKEQILARDLTIKSGSFLEAIYGNLTVQENDFNVLFALCLLHAISSNTGCRVRLVTLELCIIMLKKLVMVNQKSILRDEHYAAVIGAKEESTSLLRGFYKGEDIFLDMFENEYYNMEKRPLNIEYLMMDSNLLLQPSSTPMSGVEFTRRLPCGDVGSYKMRMREKNAERIRRAIRAFLLIRNLVLVLSNEEEKQLPLTDRNTCISVDTSLDLNDSDLITCTVLSKDGTKTRRFLAMDSNQLILVDPHPRSLGWGITKLAGFLQYVEVTGDKEDNNSLHITIQHTNLGGVYNAKFIFDDHIRCIAAKQKLTKGRMKARKKKIAQISKLLDVPTVSTAPTSETLSSYTTLPGHYRTSIIQVSYADDLGGPAWWSTLAASGSLNPLMTSIPYKLSHSSAASGTSSPMSNYFLEDSGRTTCRNTPGTSSETSPKFINRLVTDTVNSEEIQLVNLHQSQTRQDSDVADSTCDTDSSTDVKIV